MGKKRVYSDADELIKAMERHRKKAIDGEELGEDGWSGLIESVKLIIQDNRGMARFIAQQGEAQRQKEKDDV